MTRLYMYDVQALSKISRILMAYLHISKSTVEVLTEIICRVYSYSVSSVGPVECSAVLKSKQDLGLKGL